MAPASPDSVAPACGGPTIDGVLYQPGRSGFAGDPSASAPTSPKSSAKKKARERASVNGGVPNVTPAL